MVHNKGSDRPMGRELFELDSEFLPHNRQNTKCTPMHFAAVCYIPCPHLHSLKSDMRIPFIPCPPWNCQPGIPYSLVWLMGVRKY